MEKAERAEALKEWATILKNHPKFARTFLAQQAILIEASELGFRLVDRSMCQLLSVGLPVLFEDFWKTKCKIEHHEVQIGGIIGCLTESRNRDPAGCFGNDDPEGWFDDPFAGEQTLPPKPPVPPIR
jgi:hypothetical protein